MRTKYLSIIFILTLLVSSCSKVDELPIDLPVDYSQYGDPVEVEILLKPIDISAGNGVDIPFTKAPGSVDEDAINNVWIFQFGGTGDNAVLVAPPYYINNATSRTLYGAPLISSAGADHRVAIVANTNDVNFSWNMLPSTNTWADLKSRYIHLTNEATTYGATNNNIIMAGSIITKVQSGLNIDGSSNNTGTGVPLTRSVACISLNLSINNTAANYKVISVQMKDVSTRLDLLDNEIGFGASQIYPDASSVMVLDYPAEVDANGIISTGGSKTFRWYVPRNARGVNPNSTSKLTKKSYAPFNSTYIEIIAIDTANDKTLIYHIYPGANTSNDYNIVPNNKYVMTLDIKGDGGDEWVDSRIEHYHNVKFKGNSNCYILNPPRMTSMPPREFSIPITQVNRYWRASHTGYGGLGYDIINSTDNWTIELLWQDHQAMVRDITDPVYINNPENYITLSKTTGTGGDDWFTVRVPAEAVHGNFVVVIRKNGTGPILWSWHLWVTDYNPDPANVSISPTKFIYPVEGGQVERYYGKVFGYSSNFSTNWDAPTNPDTYSPAVTRTTPLAQSVIMDRYLGKLTRDYVSSNTTRGLLTYQSGRKDPYPSNIDLYNIQGNILPMNAIAAASTSFPEQYWNKSNANKTTPPNYDYATHDTHIKASIANPLTLYDAWNGLNEPTAWNDPLSPDMDYYTIKSIYDPCPEGWRIMPQASYSPTNATSGIGALSDFRVGITVNSDMRGLGWENGMKYYPYIKENGIDYTPPGYIYYPIAYIRNGGSSTTSNTTNWMVWTPKSAPTGSGKYQFKVSYYFTVLENSTSAITVNSTVDIRSYSFAIRCASEYYE